MARALTVVILMVLALAFFGCGDGDNSGGTVDRTPTVVASDTPTPAATDTPVLVATATATDTTTPTASPTATATPIPESCGDGMPQTRFDFPLEECDDGNTRDGDGCSATCSIEPTVMNFSRFDTFEFRRQQALGFCAPEGEVFDALITRTGGSFTLKGSILRDAQSCEPFGTCDDREDVMRVLTSTEAANLVDAFRAVALIAAIPTWCERIAVDPCVINAFTWDDIRAGDYECSKPSLRFGETARLVNVLNDLVVP